jgi:hypothetical protein
VMLFTKSNGIVHDKVDVLGIRSPIVVIVSPVGKGSATTF